MQQTDLQVPPESEIEHEDEILLNDLISANLLDEADAEGDSWLRRRPGRTRFLTRVLLSYCSSLSTVERAVALWC